MRVPIRVEIEPELLRAIQRTALERKTTAEAIAVEVLEEWRREGTARERHRRRTTEGLAQVAKEGRNRSNKAPFGWHLVDGNVTSVVARRDARQTLERNKAERVILDRMVQLNDAGNGAWRIAKALNAQGTGNPRTGRPWNYGTVAQILKTYRRRARLGIE